MEGIDPKLEQRVWQRVRGQQPKSTRIPAAHTQYTPESSVNQRQSQRGKGNSPRGRGR
mgnify:CR=1 FL=1